MTGIPFKVRLGLSPVCEVREADALQTTRRLIHAGAAAVVILGTGLVLSALDSVRRIDALAVEAEMHRAERALAALSVDGALTPDDVRRLREDYGLAGARFVEMQVVMRGEAIVTIPATTGETAGHVAWTPRRLGSEMFSTLAPRRIAMSMLLTLIVGFVFFWLSRTTRALDRHREAAYELARGDGLTGLANRRHFDEMLRRRFGAGTREPAALLCFDLDDFKLVNDSMGHAAGDEMLRAIGSRLRKLSGPNDVVARLGGDEFAIIRYGGASREALAAFARSAVVELCRPHRIGDTDVAVGVSIGIALAPEDGEAVGSLMHEADAALYRAKVMPGPAYVFAGDDPYKADAGRSAA